MPGRINTDALHAIPISDVIGRFVALKKVGPEQIGLCPFHEEKTPSFKVNDEKGIFHCFGCGADGDVIAFVAKREGLGFKDAAKRVAEVAGVGVSAAVPGVAPTPPQRPAKPAAAKPTMALIPVPGDAPQPTFHHGRYGNPSKVWSYRDTQGRITGYVCRFDTKTGKEIVPRHYTAKGWQWISAPKPRGLYGAELLAARPDANVIIVEGEKTCDAARVLFAQAICVTWAGGCNAIKHADWSPLTGRKVVIWPDNDDVGRAAAAKIAELLSA